MTYKKGVSGNGICDRESGEDNCGEIVRGRGYLRVYRANRKERERQDNKWGRTTGVWNSVPTTKLTVLAEEFGEVARAVLEHQDVELEEELIQVAAVVVAWLKSRK